MKPCNGCGVRERARSQTLCSPCRGQRRRASHTRTYNLRYYYGLTPGDLVRLLAEQGDCCALCGTREPGGRGGWHVDHDHSCCPERPICGRCLRGVLCFNCNLQLGTIERLDTRVGLDRALAYMGRRVA